jgi:hypothetical protein
MPYENYSSDEVVRRGEEIYRRDLKDKLEPGNKGKMVVIDIESGDYEMDPEDLEASMRLKKRRPNAVIYGLRIGYPAAYKMGFRLTEPRP